MRTKGRITSWNHEKGYGFISPNAGGERLFVHINAFRNRSRRPETNQLVTYALSTDDRGRPCAADATLAGDRLPRRTRRKSGSLSIIGAAIFLLFIGGSVLTGKIPPSVLVLYVIASIVTFLAYAADKSAARKGAWRTRESTLHVLSLLGGWPGALVAQQKLRHKSTKRSFQLAFWLTVLLNCGALVWLFTPAGTAILRSLMAVWREY
jgi:uncharacterized membrane protein YsdA (DUF1294 family)/cold shock CspA family protein